MRAKAKSGAKPELLRRLDKGAVICAEGYLFEFERRGYLQAGAFVPEVVLEHPELVEQLHREFVRAGSDVVEAFTYYGHRAKLRLIGREKDLAPMNRAALKIAKKVAKSTGTVSEFSLDDRVFHQKFGYGQVVKIDGNKLTIAFEKAGEKKVVDSFVERA